MTNRFSRYDLKGRTALVTGAGGLLGRQHVAALIEAGARVIMSDIAVERVKASAAELLATEPLGEIVPIELDVSSADSVAESKSNLDRKGISVDILINNAALDPKVTNEPGLTHSSRFEAFSVAQWEIEISVGLTGAMICSQVFGTAMAMRGNGVVLNVASDLSVIAPDQRLYRQATLVQQDKQPVKPVTYSVIKHGLLGLTKYLATYWAASGVRVNAISPGGIFNNQDRTFVDRLEQLIPMGRMAKVDEYRAAVQFLCSDASSYMTGQNIVIDGGRSIW